MQRKTKEDIKIYPKDVKFDIVPTDLWKDPKGKLWHPLHEDKARYQNATHTVCLECGNNDSEYKGGKCSKCRSNNEMLKYLSITKTTSDFPVSLDGNEFFWDECDLMEYLEENDLKIDHLFIYGCEKATFRELNLDYWDEQSQEDGTLPNILEELVKEFNEKLKDIEGYWFCDYKTRFVL